MKIFKRILITLLIIILLVGTFTFIVGFSYYSNALKEKPLISRVEDITKKENFVKYEDLAENYINAVIATEDRRYFEHGAVDFIAIVRAFYTNIKNGELDEGGSTITQQVAKNVVFDQDKDVIRKIAEIFAAYDLEKHYSKNEIFALYVNTSYFGEGYYGIYAASKGYYNKEPKDLTLDEASMLAGVPNAPSLYAPTVNMDLAKKRQKHVLNKMVENEYISQADMDKITNGTL